MKALLLVCLLYAVAHAQTVHYPSALDPVASDFCKTCRRVTTATFAGVGVVTVFERTGTYWLVIANKTRLVAAVVFDVTSAGCGAGHCDSVDRVVPSLHLFSYRIDKARVVDVGLQLEIDNTRDLLETVPRISTHWKHWLFVACGTDARGTWACRSTESSCERAEWARTAEPAVQSTCTEQLGREN